MQEIYTAGAVTTCFDVYDTFDGKGIYKCAAFLTCDTEPRPRWQ